MLNTKQTQAIDLWLGGRGWRSYGPTRLGYFWIVCDNVNHYILFDADDKIVDCQTD